VTVLATLERYYDTAPRAQATTEEVGPFTLFLKQGEGWDFYARPRLGLTDDITPADVTTVRARQRELGVAENIEWVHETTPSLLAAVRAGSPPDVSPANVSPENVSPSGTGSPGAGSTLGAALSVAECPLLVFPADPSPVQGFSRRVHDDVTARVRTVGLDDDLDAVVAVIHAGFGGTDEVGPGSAGRQVALIEKGLLGMVAAYDEHGQVVGGGSHGPRGDTTELTGIAVLPRARRRGLGAAITRALVEDAHQRGVRTVFLSAQDDAVARVYERVGFVRVGTACIAEPS
jgi:ribosomal protein S18 acetylase RimI-like enzyme